MNKQSNINHSLSLFKNIISELKTDVSKLTYKIYEIEYLSNNDFGHTEPYGSVDIYGNFYGKIDSENNINEILLKLCKQ